METVLEDELLCADSEADMEAMGDNAFSGENTRGLCGGRRW